MDDLTNLAYWFPRIEAAGLPVPRTAVVHAGGDLTCLLDGEMPEHWPTFIAKLRDAGDEIGWPCFLRTGHGSGKHEWERTCFVDDPSTLERHVGALVEWSHVVDFMGLPTDVWAIREMIPTRPLFTAFKGFPVTREFRFFVRGGGLVHWQPYWPVDAVAEGLPTDPRWKAKLAGASKLAKRTGEELFEMACAAVDAVGGGYWSVDFLEDAQGEWWLTDMAEGEMSFRYEPTAPLPSTGRQT